MTTKLLAPSPFAEFQTSGTSYTADGRGIIAAAATSDVIDLIRGGCTLLPAYNNLLATTDPDGSNDSTQGYSVGSNWINNSARRAWTCLSTAPGAAIWVLDGIVPGLGAEPANISTYFGGGSGTFLRQGSLTRLVGNPIGGNTADITDDVLASYTLPPSSFDIAGRGLRITAQGGTGPTTNSKRVRLWFDATISAGVVTGGSVIADSDAWVSGATSNNNVGWQLIANVFKYGPPEANTQYAQGSAILGGVHGGIDAPVFMTAVESASIVIAVTGSSFTSGVANDIVATWFEIDAMN